jgi:hypothetical protein
MIADVPARFGMVFDINNPRASEWLRSRSSDLIQGDLVPAQRQAIQVALQQGFDLGRNPRTTALDLVGRVDKATGRRLGGLINLSDPQQQWATNARKQLAELDRRYLKRRLRDRSFDAVIERAIDSGRPLKKSVIDKAVERYEQRLLKLRGDTIARTETLAAVNAASDESLNQVIQEGLAKPENIERIWRHSFERRPRPGHRRMDGDPVAPNEPWRNPSTGAYLMRPGDGPAAEVINCRCTVEHRIAFEDME